MQILCLGIELCNKWREYRPNSYTHCEYSHRFSSTVTTHAACFQYKTNIQPSIAVHLMYKDLYAQHQCNISFITIMNRKICHPNGYISTITYPQRQNPANQLFSCARMLSSTVSASKRKATIVCTTAFSSCANTHNITKLIIYVHTIWYGFVDNGITSRVF